MVMEMTAPVSSGQTGTQLTRTLERALEETQITGELKFSGKKLKEFPKFSSKYDLSDTVSADLSKNKFNDIPTEVCEFNLLERLNCYHNAIRSIPDSVLTLQCLCYLNLSRNSLSTIPTALCHLPLQVLILSNNKLISVPEEIGHMQHLMDLDVSCNEITILPPHIGDLQQLRNFNIRRNLLLELPQEVCELRLVKLDISANKISNLPIMLRLMNTLEELVLDHNPLTSPPAFLCTRGKVHIFKFLEIQALKESKKQGAFLEGEFRKSSRKPPLLSDFRFQNGTDRKRCTLDSGYNTSDGGDKRWSQEIQDFGSSDLEESRKLALRAAEQTKEQRRERDLRRFTSPQPTLTDKTPVIETVQTPVGPPPKLNGEEAHINGSNISPTTGEFKKPFPQAQTYREFKEALKLQRSSENNNIYKRPTNGEKSPASSPIITSMKTEESVTAADPPMNLEEEFKIKHKAMMTHQRFEAAQLQKRLEVEKSQTKEALIQPTKVHQEPSKSPRKQPPPTPKYLPLKNGSDKNYSSPNNKAISSSPKTPLSNPHLTMRRELDKAREEQELVRRLREIIETRLKVRLPEELGPALVDGVVLCHLANNVCPHSVSSIHVPSPSVPKLTMAKCRKNVENFLDVCRRVGVPNSAIFEWQSELDLASVLKTLEELVDSKTDRHRRSWQDTLLCAALLTLLVASFFAAIYC